RSLETSRPERAGRPVASAAHSDAVDHHILAAGMIDDLCLADEWLAESRRTAVLPVAQDENHRSPFPIVFELSDRVIDSPPQGSRGVRRDDGRQRAAKFAD